MAKAMMVLRVGEVFECGGFDPNLECSSPTGMDVILTQAFMMNVHQSAIMHTYCACILCMHA